MRFALFVTASFVVHLFIFLGLHSLQGTELPRIAVTEIGIVTQSQKEGSQKKPRQSLGRSRQSLLLGNNVDLRPDSIKRDDNSSKSAEEGAVASGFPNEEAREMLFSESRVSDAFDLLAAKIGYRLDYPELLAENGIRGLASLELFFDSDGNVDKRRSVFSGSHRTLRGLLVRATRTALVEWFVHESYRLKKSEFRNQYFRVEFILAGHLDEHLWDERPTTISSELKKEGRGRYHFLKKRAFTCAIDTGVDLGCVAIRAGGTIKNLFNGKRKSEFSALVDRLEDYDQLGLNGIVHEIEKTARAS